MRDNTLVYSTETGRITSEESPAQRPKGDGIVRVRRETKGRKGKGMTIIEGLDMEQTEIKALCTKLKKLCGCGGAVKHFIIEIQGDNRDKIKAYLEEQGFKVKLAGG